MLRKHIPQPEKSSFFRQYSATCNYFPYTCKFSNTESLYRPNPVFKCASQETLLNRILCCGDVTAERNNLLLFCLSEMFRFFLFCSSVCWRENRGTERCTFPWKIMRLPAEAAGGGSHLYTVSLFSLQSSMMTPQWHHQKVESFQMAFQSMTVFIIFIHFTWTLLLASTSCPTKYSLVHFPGGINA